MQQSVLGLSVLLAPRTCCLYNVMCAPSLYAVWLWGKDGEDIAREHMQADKTPQLQKETSEQDAPETRGGSYAGAREAPSSQGGPCCRGSAGEAQGSGWRGGEGNCCLRVGISGTWPIVDHACGCAFALHGITAVQRRRYLNEVSSNCLLVYSQQQG
jgi:hypothetical protein